MYYLFNKATGKWKAYKTYRMACKACRNSNDLTEVWNDRKDARLYKNFAIG
jgi:hypothetical protein